MIEFLGITIAWETILFIGAFVASEFIGSSNLKENSVAAMVKNYVDIYLKKAKGKNVK